ncbi:MAG: acetate--CoA ligase family protein [Alphaproteobacteria bacterium]
MPIAASLERLLRPRGVVFVGASEDMSRYSGRALRYALEGGFAGEIHAVNPKHATLFRRPCHRDLADVPGPVDVAVALVGPARIPALMAACRAKGVGFLLAIGALAEGAAARETLAALRAEARALGPRIVGPMGVGVVVPPARLAMSISSGLVGGLPANGGVAVVSQSGGILGAVMDRARVSRVGFSALVSSGQELDLGTTDFVAALLDDLATRTIAVYAEDVDDWPRFLALARAARQQDKVVAALIAGRAAAGEAAALSHSGRIAGAAEIVAATLARHGAVALGDIDDLHVTAAALARHRVQRATGLAALSLSGGYAVVLGDLMSEAGVAMARLGPETLARIRASGAQAHPANPLDAAGRGVPGMESADLRACLEAFDDDPNVGATLYGETAFLNPETAVPGLIDFARSAKKPHVVCWQSGPSVTDILGRLNDAGIIAVDTPDRAARTFKALWDHAAWRPAVAEPSASPRLSKGSHPPGPLADDAAKLLMAAYEVPLVAEQSVPANADVVATADRLGYPVALKGIVAGVVHKTERGLVRVGLGDAAAVREAARAMNAASSDLVGFAVQRMAAGLEFLVGVKSDARLGPALILGFGGVLAEAMDRRAVVMAPIDEADAQGMIESVDGKRLLDGWRGSGPLARDRLAALLQAVGRLAWAERDFLAELDLNPVIVGAHAAVAVDVAVIVR